ncbi:plasmid recombination protein [Frigidibacter mobilis]|nr:plasmid recombination protein [Frigidibacter mobilis]
MIMPVVERAKSYAIVARCEGMFPADLARYEAHRTRKGGDLGHISPERSGLNRRLIGAEDWASTVLAKIADMRQQNFADELEELDRRGRRKEIRQRILEGPKDPWRASRHGPLREIILTANAAFFANSEVVDPATGMRKAEVDFESRAVAWLKEEFKDSVVHARADRDEHAYHIHAVIVHEIPIEVKGAPRRMLQPSALPLIKDYKELQDSVGKCFADIGLVRGEQRAEAIRKAYADKTEPPVQPRHVRPKAWRQAKDLELLRREAAVKVQEGAAAEREQAVEAKAVEADAAAAAQMADAADRERRNAVHEKIIAGLAKLSKQELGQLQTRTDTLTTREQDLVAKATAVAERERAAEVRALEADAAAAAQMAAASERERRNAARELLIARRAERNRLEGGQLQTRADALTTREQDLAAEAAAVAERERAAKAKAEAAEAKTAEADAVIAVAESVEAGLLTFEAGPAGPRAKRHEDKVEPGLVTGLMTRMRASVSGRTLAITALGKAWSKLRTDAKTEAETRLRERTADLDKADAALVEVAKTLPEAHRNRFAAVYAPLASILTRIRRDTRRGEGREGEGER